MKGTEGEIPDAHFTVDKQNISLWPQEPPPKSGLCVVLRKAPAIGAVLVCLTLVLVASLLLQGILYPWFMGTISDVKTNAQLLKGRVDNISALGSEIKKNSGSVEAAGLQFHLVNASLSHVRSQILKLQTSVEKANAQIQTLTRNWEEVDTLNAQIPELKRDLDKASALNAKIRNLQSSLENTSKLLKQQSDILQMVSRGWRYFNGNFYYFSPVLKTWYSAEQFCVSKNSHLTSVTSDSEQAFLSKSAAEVIRWIGLTKAGTEGGWHWIDDTPFNKAQTERYWIPGEPNNSGFNEHCVSIRVLSLQSWNDSPCDIKYSFICKRPYIPSEP
ncbi:C-type lectin domain family 4 member K [Otolemur garnettii]|uniref:C-type lectin domain family 4 member K n=1 Tax=Otolemur garnettii TaxID=30611 RepID=UPI0002740FD1|nr:C-type lectin domain family 4 member K [Otolemur garnettii]